MADKIDSSKPFDERSKSTHEQNSWVQDCNGDTARRVTDPCAIAKLQEIIDKLEPGQGGGLECQQLVLDLPANTFTQVPHTFTETVCDYKTFDNLGNEIDIVGRKNGILLELCPTINLTNVLVLVEGE